MCVRLSYCFTLAGLAADVKNGNRVGHGITLKVIKTEKCIHK